ncbi:hypothetical protein [uncultured Gammaproteobacteria bacterium]|uniref:restriction endonuclease PLD domain-containing protein n=1 Tax=Bathymodiolus heckerae thiotrophic gill symbiont TaxID=1052212 RepID=UPI0010B94074|nr:restriction endonuclease PLD domain-containing protein [Bathymodiolus heckerae thiotrophic gill symbiont]CAC9595628.1 hypothetical protein [uncultured Gammaproteobacteria bacterium]CAC9963823.1 hypothetical protein [uncultured Gammaproteobacteria bacterium]SHN92093.1 hypothetical protein BHECKSOX_136 [Bathymodiolus heckerae thiotrophic gill symbiont]
MFFSKQTTSEQRKKYQDFLKIVGSLSNLYSDSKTPYLYYRIAEKLFCKAFNADDLSRSDVSADAKKNGIGIGLKTFLAKNNKSFQKIAEFNSDREAYVNFDNTRLIQKIAELRNARIRFTEDNHAINNSIYHCVLREEGKFKIFEASMDRVDIANIQDIKRKKNTISLHDNINEYSFSLSKSTLSKRFVSDNPKLILDEFDVDILKDPLSDLQKCFTDNAEFITNTRIKQTIYLPLYGTNGKVQERSALNQWNAQGRIRNENEVYISIPALIHKVFPNFFPSRDVVFSLKLPNGKILDSKVCQDNGKALMSNPNKDLGKWILRSILRLNSGELLIYARLKILGIDSIRVDKIDDKNFEINFAKVGTYEIFKEAYLN